MCRSDSDSRLVKLHDDTCIAECLLKESNKDRVSTDLPSVQGLQAHFIEYGWKTWSQQGNHGCLTLGIFKDPKAIQENSNQGSKFFARQEQPQVFLGLTISVVSTVHSSHIEKILSS